MEKKQPEVDDWMCKRINRIINELNEKIAPDINTAIGKISAVMTLANRRQDKEGNYVTNHFTDRDRNNFDYYRMS
jgi:hypothetical protein